MKQRADDREATRQELDVLKREVSRASNQADTITQLMQSAADWRLAQTQVQSFATDIEHLRRDVVSKRAFDQVQAAVETLRRDASHRSTDVDKAVRDMKAMSTSVAQLEGKLSKLVEDTAAVAVLRRSTKEAGEGVERMRTDLRQLAEEHSFERERTDRQDQRVTDLEKALAKLAKTDVVTQELDELGSRLRVQDEETTRRLAMLRAEFDVARNDLDAVTVKFAEDALPQLLTRLDKTEQRVSAFTDDVRQVEATLDDKLANLREKFVQQQSHDSKEIGKLREFFASTARMDVVETDMAKLEAASAGVKDVIGEDGKHFFELLRLGQEAKELAAVLEARFGSLDKRVQADRKAVLEKLEQLRTQTAAYELQ